MERVARLSSWVLLMGVILLFMVAFTSETRALTLPPGFYIEFVDGPDDDNTVSFSVIFTNADDRTYWVGIALPDHSWMSDGIAVDSGSNPSYTVDLLPGTYDIYVAWDRGSDNVPDVYVWTSQPGMATYAINSSDPSPTLSIAWQNDINFSQFQFTFNGDGFRVQPVPLPAGAWLLGAGLVGVALGRKFKVTK